MDIDTMPAGRELDALVAERVMGWKLFASEPGYGRPPHQITLVLTPIPHYSTDIAAAWIIVEKLRDMWTEATEGVSGFVDDFPRPFDDNVFFEYLHRRADRRWPWAFLYVTPHNICRAALKATGAAHE